jgi:nucleoside-triphosphatase THEP1
MSFNIYILSQPVQTGKTTLLMNWIGTQKNVGGILTPDINGKRKLYDVGTQAYHDLQLNEDADGLKIGRFVFDETVFEHARNILSHSAKQQYSWVVVDEIGRLEMDRKDGLEPAISELIHHYKTHPIESKLLLVIRDYLLQPAIDFYGLEEANILQRGFFEVENSQDASTAKPITGLVLCGGQSVRMGSDKAFLEYHGKPQCYHLYDELQTIYNNVFISCNESQKQKSATTTNASSTMRHLQTQAQ